MKLKPRLLLGFLPALLTPAVEIVLFRKLGDEHPLPLALGLLILTLFLFGSWIAWRLSARQAGWVPGRMAFYPLALVYPLLVMSPLVVLAVATQNAQPDSTRFGEFLGQAGLVFVGTLLGTLLTEEGFFRGALFGGLRQAGLSLNQTILWTTLAFAAWHLYVPWVEAPMKLPLAQLPAYYLNVLLLGGFWGLLRAVSGSMWVPCLAHSSWNALAYTFFGHGLETGGLGVDNVFLFGAERGLLGVVVNALAFWWLWRYYLAHRRA